MTCEYHDINPLDALYNAARAYPGGIEALALRMGMSAATLRKKLMPSVDSHLLGYGEAAQAIALIDSVLPEQADLALRAFNWQFDRVTLKLPAPGAADCDAILGQVLKVFGDEGRLAQDIDAALKAPSSTSRRNARRDLAVIEADLAAVIDDLMTLRGELRSRLSVPKKS